MRHSVWCSLMFWSSSWALFFLFFRILYLQGFSFSQRCSWRFKSYMTLRRLDGKHSPTNPGRLVARATRSCMVVRDICWSPVWNFHQCSSSSTEKFEIRVISGFRREVDENSVLQGYYATSMVISYLCFGNYRSRNVIKNYKYSLLNNP